MAETYGSIVLGKSLKAVGVDTIFFLLGGPNTDIYETARDLGIRLIDVRHEQAAAMAAHAYARITGKPGVCMAGAGVDTMNLVTGIATASSDCSPVVAICGSASMKTNDMDAFQDLDQYHVMKPLVKKAWRVPIPERVPSYVGMAFRAAISGKPGPVYLEFPASTINVLTEESKFDPLPTPPVRQHPLGDPDLVKQAIQMLAKAERPVVIAGDGVVWSGGGKELRDFVESTSIPYYTTPLCRGQVPEDHPLSFPSARASAWREADAILLIGARTSFIIFFLAPPQFSAQAKLISVNIDAEELGHNRRVDLGIMGDAKAVLKQLTEEAGKSLDKKRYAAWVQKLKQIEAKKHAESQAVMNSDQKPIHPARLCKEVRAVLPRDGILVNDGNEIMHFSRHTMPIYEPYSLLNPGVSGCMGVGIPYGLGAKVARPDKPVLVLTGDGAFGFNEIEIDVMVRHNLPVVIVISNNGGWSSCTAGKRSTPGRDLAFTHYEKVCEALGGYGEFVEEAKDIRPALERAFASGKPAVVNVITDPHCGAPRQQFATDVGSRYQRLE